MADRDATTETPIEVPPESVSGAGPAAEPRSFDDWTLDELLNALVRSPRATWRRLVPILKRTPDESPETRAGAARIYAPPSISAHESGNLSAVLDGINKRDGAGLLLYLAAFASGLIGASTLLRSQGGVRAEAISFAAGAPFLWLAILLWLCAEFVCHLPRIQDWLAGKDQLARLQLLARVIPVLLALSAPLTLNDALAAPAEQSLSYIASAVARLLASVGLWLLIDLIWRRLRNGRFALSSASFSQLRRPRFADLGFNISRRRVSLAAGLCVSSVIVWFDASGNRMQPAGIGLWLLGSLLWALLFAPAKWHGFEWLSERIDAWRRINWRGNRGLVAAFALIMLLGIAFRFGDLDAVPREMTADHVEKLQDAYRIHQGDYPVYLPNNGGREPMQMYLAALLATLPGFEFDFYALKWLSALEGVLALPLLFWLGWELLGKRRRRINTTFALLLMALAAASYWHVVMSRQGLRIPLTVIVSCLILIHLARGMRHNQRADYAKAGLALGFGLYAYQAARIMPLYIVAGVGIAILLRATNWRERLKYLANLAVLAFVALMVYLPMLRYATEDPLHYSTRLSERIVGVELAEASLDEILLALPQSAHVFLTNTRDALLMFHWKGNSGWFSNADELPAMDIFSGALLAIGVAAWGVRLLRSRDPVLWLIPLYILIMQLPSTLGIAFPEANPNFGRTLNTLPAVYAMAALPLTVIAMQLRKVLPGRLGAGWRC